MSDVPAARWEGCGETELAARWGVPDVRLFARVGSTNDVARALGEAGAPSGTVVLAEEQTAGRGRGGKGWSSPAGLGIWLSLLVRPDSLPSPGLLPILVGLAAAAALDPFARPVPVGVKWPNDLHLAGRKAGGILCEATRGMDGAHAVVVGIGLNVGHAPGDFPPELRAAATSLRIASGWSPPRAEVAGAVVSAVLRAVSQPPERMGGGLLEEMRARDVLLGRVVRISGEEDVVGTSLGVTPEGALLLRADGRLRTIRSGTVRPEEPAAPPV